ncbi:MAG: hypothetical protein PWP04_1271 [Candidatus Atribacteria bacterium]|nr:hypothetical protein [Candidatus Atribacteria bacterium]
MHRKRKSWLAILVPLLVITLLGGCVSTPSPSPPSGTSYPLPPGASGHIYIEFPETTKVIDKPHADLLSFAYPDAPLTFSESTPWLESLAPGDVIICGRTDQTPHGLLRKVAEVTSTNGLTTVHTEEVTLENSTKNSDIDIRGSDTATITLGEIDSSIKGVPFSLELGKVKIKYDYEFKLKIGWFNLKEFKLRLKITNVWKPGLTVGGEIDLTDRTIWESSYHEIGVIEAGPIPIVIEAKFLSKLTASLLADIALEQETDLFTSAGFEYKDGDWHFTKDWDISTKPMNIDTEAGAEIEFTLGPKISTKILGVAGPYFWAGGLLETDFDAETKCGDFYEGIKLTAGAEAKILSFSLGHVEFPPFEKKKELGEFCF